MDRTTYHPNRLDKTHWVLSQKDHLVTFAPKKVLYRFSLSPLLVGLLLVSGRKLPFQKQP